MMWASPRRHQCAKVGLRRSTKKSSHIVKAIVSWRRRQSLENMIMLIVGQRHIFEEFELFRLSSSPCHDTDANRSQ